MLHASRFLSRKRLLDIVLVGIKAKTTDDGGLLLNYCLRVGDDNVQIKRELFEDSCTCKVAMVSHGGLEPPTK